MRRYVQGAIAFSLVISTCGDATEPESIAHAHASLNRGQPPSPRPDRSWGKIEMQVFRRECGSEDLLNCSGGVDGHAT